MIRFAPLNKQDSNSSVSTPVGKHGKPTKEAQVSSIILEINLSLPHPLLLLLIVLTPNSFG